MLQQAIHSTKAKLTSKLLKTLWKTQKYKAESETKRHGENGVRGIKGPCLNERLNKRLNERGGNITHICTIHKNMNQWIDYHL